MLLAILLSAPTGLSIATAFLQARHSLHHFDGVSLLFDGKVTVSVIDGKSSHSCLFTVCKLQIYKALCLERCASDVLTIAMHCFCIATTTITKLPQPLPYRLGPLVLRVLKHGPLVVLGVFTNCLVSNSNASSTCCYEQFVVLVALLRAMLLQCLKTY
jgi:hypothetical protein